MKVRQIKWHRLPNLTHLLADFSAHPVSYPNRVTLFRNIVLRLNHAQMMTSTQQLNLHLEEPGDDHLCDQIIDILRKALQPDATMSLEVAVEQIVALLPRGHPYSHEVGQFVETCYEAAEQIPYNHPSMIKLVTIIDSCLNSSKLLEGERAQVSRFRARELLSTTDICSTAYGVGRSTLPIDTKCSEKLSVNGGTVCFSHSKTVKTPLLTGRTQVADPLKIQPNS